MTIVAENISYAVPSTISYKLNASINYRFLHKQFDPGKSHFKTILDDVSFSVSDGEFVGIIGSSGCGKTSLINIVCNRLYTRTFSGKVTLNGQPVGPWAKRHIGYVYQEDILGDCDKVKESIEFVANMRLPGMNHKDLVSRILDGLNLAHVAESTIGAAAGTGFKAGTNKTGISGGERRRTSIGRQLVSGCEVLILDECTSGLDVHTANMLISLLKELSSRPYDYFINPESRAHNLTVITTIHQPTSQMWDLFDRIIVMKKGKIYYNIRPREFRQALSACEIDVPLSINPADFLIEILSVGSCHEADVLREYYGKSVAVDQKAVAYQIEEEHGILELGEDQPIDLNEVDSQKILNLSKTPAQMYKAFRAERKYAIVPFILVSLYEILHYNAKYVQSYDRQFYLLSKRAWMNQIRYPLMPIRFFAYFTIVALFAGSLWWRLGNSFTDVGNKIGAVFFVELTLCFGPSADASQRWFEKRYVYLSEHAQGLYGTMPYLLAELLADIPIYMFIVFYTLIITYYMINFNSSFQLYLLFSVELFLLMYGCIMMSVAITFIFGSFVASVAVYMTLMAILIVFSGPYINSKSIPPYWIWMQWVSIFTYQFRAYFYLLMWNKPVVCSPNELCPIDGGTSIYEVYGQEGWSLVSATLCALGFMAGWILGFFLLAYNMLRYRRFS